MQPLRARLLNDALMLRDSVSKPSDGSGPVRPASRMLFAATIIANAAREARMKTGEDIPGVWRDLCVAAERVMGAIENMPETTTSMPWDGGDPPESGFFNGEGGNA